MNFQLFYSFFKSLVGKDVVVELKNDLRYVSILVHQSIVIVGVIQRSTLNTLENILFLLQHLWHITFSRPIPQYKIDRHQRKWHRKIPAHAVSMRYWCQQISPPTTMRIRSIYLPLPLWNDDTWSQLFIFNNSRSVKNCFIRGSVVRYVQLPGDEVDTQLLQDAARKEAVTSTR